MDIFNEYTENQKRAKEKIKREKMADKAKHDRMMDAARSRDTSTKNTRTEAVEFHVRMDHLDGSSRQKKVSTVMRKHERAGHVEYVGNTDKGVVFKAKSKSHADRMHRELKPHGTGVEHMSEGMSPESQKAHRNMFKAAQKKKDDSAAQAEREKRLKARGYVRNDRGGMSKVSEAVDSADTGGEEEVSMGTKQIKAMRHFLDGIEKRINKEGDMEEWYQNKLTKASDYLKTLYSYGKGDDVSEEMIDEISQDTARSYFNKVGDKSKKEIQKRKAKGGPQRAMGRMYPDHPQYGTRKEERSAQDPDIKDREGTQPAAYHKGLKKTTKAKRDAHFKKHGKKADDDASAYKDAPGDKKARKGDMPKSKYTKFVDNMMKEGTDFAAHRAKPKLTSSDQKKMAKVADMLRKEREKKAAMKEDAQVDEGAYKGKDAFGRGVTAALRGGKAGAYMSRKAKERSDMNKKNDPGSAKKGYALSVTDKDKAMRKARKKGLSPKHPSTNYNRKLPEATSKFQSSGMPKQEKLKKDHQHLSYVTHGGQKGRIQVHKDKAFAALNHYRKNNKSAQLESYEISEDAGKSLAAKAEKSGISVGTLRKVYNRGVAAWKTGHRPGTTPSQWGHARVNAFITKKKKGGLNHDKDLA